MIDENVNIMIGPPSDSGDCGNMIGQFILSEGRHIVCGGTTSSLVADYLGKTVKVSLDYVNPDVPPIAEIEGVDLVTEGVVTVTKVVEYAINKQWRTCKDGAALICRMIFDRAENISLFIGKARNPAQHNLHKEDVLKKLIKHLCMMGKNVNIKYF